MSDADTVTVQPLRTYGGVDGMKTPHDKPYEVSRARAADLRANGLVGYIDPADEATASDAAAQAASDAVKAARTPKNKMAVEPGNKDITSSTMSALKPIV